jgi:hypothetical protein
MLVVVYRFFVERNRGHTKLRIPALSFETTYAFQPPELFGCFYYLRCFMQLPVVNEPKKVQKHLRSWLFGSL